MVFSKKTVNLVVLLILVLAIFLRIWGINSAPPGVLVDEAAFGFNAYSILTTGKDEWGQRFPLTFRSFGDYKPPGYIYLTVPFVKLFGLNSFSTRLPSSISGVVSVYIVFILIKLLTKKNGLALLSSFILAISPWHIYMSRMAWDSNIALMFLLIGLFFLLKACNRGIPTLILSSLFFSLALYSYAGYRLLTPVVIIAVLIYLYLKKMISIKKIIFFLFFIFIFSSPLIPEILFKGALSRFNQVSIFSQKNTSIVIDEKRAFCGMQENTIILKICYIVWNKPLVTATTLLKRYISALSYDFLFYPGDNALFLNNPEHGGLYYWLLPFFIIGLARIVKEYKETSHQLILLLLLIAPLTTAISGSPHYERANLVFIPIIFICALGCDFLFQKLKKNKKLKNISMFAFIAISLASVFVTMIDYLFIYTKKAMAWDEQYAYIYKYLSDIDSNYKKVYIKKMNTQPYIYMLFYQVTDPNFFQNNAKKDGFEVLSVGKYIFTENNFDSIYCSWQKEGKIKTIFVTNDLDYSFSPLYTVYSFNNVHKLSAIYDLEKTEAYLKSKDMPLPKCN